MPDCRRALSHPVTRPPMKDGEMNV